MFFRDLEPYRYNLATELTDVVSIGWLCGGRDYPQGEPTVELVDALDHVLSSHRVNQMRGYHPCEFCSKPPLVVREPRTGKEVLLRPPLVHETRSGQKVWLGSAEIWVPALGQAVIYAAPDLIYHYVNEHRYLPPTDFINAVLSAFDSRDWDANIECQKRLEAAFRA
jgi:hypothetical protein